MTVKLVDIILALLIEGLIGGIFALFVNKNIGKYHLCTIIKPYAGDKAGRCYLYSFNKSIGRYYPHKIIESY